MATIIAMLGAYIIVGSILYGIGSTINDSDCVSMTFEQMCETSSVITLTWGVFEGHATNDSGERIVVKESYPQLIAKASKYGLYPSTNSETMVTLTKK